GVLRRTGSVADPARPDLLPERPGRRPVSEDQPLGRDPGAPALLPADEAARGDDGAVRPGHAVHATGSPEHGGVDGREIGSDRLRATRCVRLPGWATCAGP